MRLVERLQVESARGPLAAALAARDAVASDPQATAAIADNSDLDMSVRIAALLALALVAQDGVFVPDPALSALEDDLLVDAVLANGAASALTGVLCAAGPRVSDGLRRYLALRIAASGATGVHVAELLLVAGDVDGAIRTVTPTLVAVLRDATDTDPTTLALATIVDAWSRTHAGLDDRLAAALPQVQRDRLALALRHVRTS